MSESAPQTVSIPYVDLAAQHRRIKQDLLRAVERVLDSGDFILSPLVADFERRFAGICGVQHAIGVNSGTDALILALRALGVGQGDEVITVPNSFIATASAIAMVGAQPVFVDVRHDYNMDPAALAAAITTRTKAVIPVHLTGRPAALNEICCIARENGIDVVEDAAQAVSAALDGRPVGSWGRIGCLSLHPLKTLNACGDGGMLTTDDPALAERLRILRNIGLQSRDNCVLWSGNSRLDAVQASMLLVKLEYLDQWTETRRRNAAYYRERLAGLEEISLPRDAPGERAVYHTFVIQAERRDDLKAHLYARGIGTSVHYPIPIHLHPAAASLGLSRGAFPVAERQAASILSLPVYSELTERQLDAVVEAIRSFYT